jgi:predicted RNase H-like nuclease
LIAGIDGCRGGWYVIEANHQCSDVRGRVFPSFDRALSAIPAHSIIGIDIPIGLQSVGARACDEAARRYLGPKRASSVFTAPIRPVLGASSHAAASAMRRGIEGKGMSIQAFGITAKVREVDTALRAASERAQRVFEVHPEVSFTRLNGAKALTHSKKRPLGREQRLELLAKANQLGDAPARLVATRPKTIVEPDDVLDAFIALWTARRILEGTAQSFPEHAGQDGVGLRMGIFY